MVGNLLRRSPGRLERVEQLTADIIRLGGTAESMTAKALQAFSRRDLSLAKSVRQLEKQVNVMEYDIDRQAEALFGMNNLKAEDLRLGMGALKIASDLERIGDLSENIAKRTILLTTDGNVDLYKGINRMGRLVLLLLNDVLDAFGDMDVEKASAVWLRDHDVDEHYDSLLENLINVMRTESGTVQACTHLLFVAKHLERIGDHATNIAESIYFIATGESPDRQTMRALGQRDGDA